MRSVTDCVAVDNQSIICNASTSGWQTFESTCTCSNSSRPIISRSNSTCSPTCPGKSKLVFNILQYMLYVLFVVTVTEIPFDDTVSDINLMMRITPIPLPFPYQYTNESNTHKLLWVTFFYI
jgi:hypothetical protein